MPDPFNASPTRIEQGKEFKVQQFRGSQMKITILSG